VSRLTLLGFEPHEGILTSIICERFAFAGNRPFRACGFSVISLYEMKILWSVRVEDEFAFVVFNLRQDSGTNLERLLYS